MKLKTRLTAAFVAFFLLPATAIAQETTLSMSSTSRSYAPTALFDNSEQAERSSFKDLLIRAKRNVARDDRAGIVSMRGPARPE